MRIKLPWNPGKPGAQLGVLILITLLVIGFATKCAYGAEAYPQFAAGSTFVRGEAPTISLGLVYPDRVRDIDYEIGATFIAESTFRDQVQSNNFALHAGIVDGFGRFDVGLGVAYLQNIDEYNGSHLNFQLMLGYKFKKLPLTVRVQHFSNGGTQRPNRGRDMLLIYYRF